MKTALIVKEDGLIYAAEVPECQMCEGECIHNPDPKDSAVLVSDQEKAIRLIYESLGETTPIWNGWINMFKKNAVPKVYPMPDLSWEVVGMDETGNSNCSDDNVVQEVAILKESTPSTEQESQEELINELIHETFGASLAGREAIAKKFTITRKP